MITAAHCCFPTEPGVFTYSFVITIGAALISSTHNYPAEIRQGRTSHQESGNMQDNDVYVPPEFFRTTDAKARWDICIIELKQPIATEKPLGIKPASTCKCITPPATSAPHS